MLPLAEVTALETPSLNISDGSSFSFKEGGALKWIVRVNAGVGDSLLWLHNNAPVPSVNFTEVCGPAGNASTHIGTREFILNEE